MLGRFFLFFKKEELTGLEVEPGEKHIKYRKSIRHEGLRRKPQADEGYRDSRRNLRDGRRVRGGSQGLHPC